MPSHPASPPASPAPDAREARGGSKHGPDGEGAAVSPLAPGLVLVATPIGNLADMSRRAAEALRAADLVLCEDTRVTRKLAVAHGVSTPLSSYHEHNAARVRPGVLARLRAGARIALVSDAGTPAISDPGYRLVRACRDEGIPVSTVPGPTAPVAALTVSGLPTDRFYFGGFLPPRAAARRRALGALAGLDATLVFLESPRRLAALMADAAALLPGRRAAVARELTKLHEEVREGTAAELAAHYGAAGPPRGEAVALFGPPERAREAATAAEIDAALRRALAGGSVRDAARAAAAETGAPRAAVYRRALELSGPEGAGR